MRERNSDAMSVNGFGLGEGGGFTVELDTKHTLQIYEKLSYEALNLRFCQTRVTCWASFGQRAVVSSL